VDAVVFQIGERRCSLELQQVEEVIRLGPITPIPSAAPTVLGAMNLRGQVVAVVDPCMLAFGDAVDEGGAAARVGLLVQTRGCRLVLRVDRVEGVVPVPELGSSVLDLDALLDRLLAQLESFAGRWTGPSQGGEAAHE